MELWERWEVWEGKLWEEGGKSEKNGVPGAKAREDQEQALVASPGTQRGRCAVTRSQRPWPEWVGQGSGQIRGLGSVCGMQKQF